MPWDRVNGDKIEELERRIQELEEGSCRFNCREGRDAFIAGYELAHGWGLTDREKQVIGGREYNKWRREQREKTTESDKRARD